MNKKLEQKIKALPRATGVYLFRDKDGIIIYVGKAVNLRSRVSSYFSLSQKDQKTAKLVENIQTLDIRITENEIDALVLESELIKRYRPKYNINWRDDKNYSYLKISQEDYPRITLVRSITDDRANYLGPYIDTQAIRSALSTLRRAYPYCSCGKVAKKPCLFYHLGLCPGNDEGRISHQDYQKNIKKISKFFTGGSQELIIETKRKMQRAASKNEYEKAATLRERYLALLRASRIRIVGDPDISSDKALEEIAVTLSLSKIPSRIECYDISNISGRYPVGSMVVFENGLPKKNHYRHFKLFDQKKADDFKMIGAVIGRRIKKVGLTVDQSFRLLPDLIIIDGGNLQLKAAYLQLDDSNHKITAIGLAKKREEIHYRMKDNTYSTLYLPDKSEGLFLLQRIRDEAHRFALNYHRLLRSKNATKSELDNIKGLGPKKKQILMDNFGSLAKIKTASLEDLGILVGVDVARKLKGER